MSRVELMERVKRGSMEHRPPLRRGDDAHWGPLDRLARRAFGLPRSASAAVIVVLLAGTTVLVVADGTKTATPHLFYLPIVLAALAFGVVGALGTAVVSAVLCAVVPIDVGTGERQTLLSLLIRAVMFFVVAVVVSGALAIRQLADHQQHFQELRSLIGPSPAPAPTVHPSLLPLVPDVLLRQAFHPVFQPIYSLRSGDLIAVEALTRFEVEPYRSPDQWFAAAEQAGLGVELEVAAIESALSAAVDLPLGVILSLNASPATVADDRIHALVSAAGERVLMIEVTEHAAIKDYALFQTSVGRLRAAGVLVAVDDAGAGFASLQHIVEVLPDVIKLDLTLTQDVSSSPARRALGGALIEFVHHIGATLVVEGIETEEDLDVWVGLGADAVQGYLVGRPGPLPVPLVSARVAVRNDRSEEPVLT